MKRILIVEDNVDLASGLRRNLEVEGHKATVAGTAAAAIETAMRESPDLLVLDLGLPDRDGYYVLEQLRSRGCSAPVLILSARGLEADKVRGFRLGADDYVTKPFAMDELLARLRAMSRRVGAPEDEPVVSFGDVVVDLAARRVRRGDAEVRLTPTEWHLLEVLLRHPGKLLSQRQLLAEVWGPGYETAQGNLRLYMAQLRKKLEPDPARPRHLVNEPGMGYRFEA